MRICFIADLRSPIAASWIGYFAGRGDDAHVISSYPVEPRDFPYPVYVMPLLFSDRTHQRVSTIQSSSSVVPSGSTIRQISPQVRTWLKGARGLELVSSTRAFVGPLEIRRHASACRRIIEQIQPDIVHAMRIPYESMLAARSLPRLMPFVVSVWGNDFTLFAAKNPIIASETRQVLQHASGLITDCHRDVRLARQWGLPSDTPCQVLPGSGGVHLDVFHPGNVPSEVRASWTVADDALVVLNPRGIRGYVKTLNLLRAFRTVLERFPNAMLVCTGTAGNRKIEKLAHDLGIADRVRLGPVVNHSEMADLYRISEISVSPSVHDGTPNSLLEAMASGCLPVAGDIESVREWLQDGINGILCDPEDPESIAGALERGLEDANLRDQARLINRDLVLKRAMYEEVMQSAQEFYSQVIYRGNTPGNQTP